MEPNGTPSGRFAGVGANRFVHDVTSLDGSALRKIHDGLAAMRTGIRVWRSAVGGPIDLCAHTHRRTRRRGEGIAVMGAARIWRVVSSIDRGC